MCHTLCLVHLKNVVLTDTDTEDPWKREASFLHLLSALYCACLYVMLLLKHWFPQMVTSSGALYCIYCISRSLRFSILNVYRK